MYPEKLSKYFRYDDYMNTNFYGNMVFLSKCQVGRYNTEKNLIFMVPVLLSKRFLCRYDGLKV